MKNTWFLLILFFMNYNTGISSSRKANNLINESSPYLLQHAHNPVNWYPWGEEALQKAKKENKLILVSIGYSSCHWCHVMEKESFENDSVAAVMNKNFVCVKVDREERPDIDEVYMTALQLLSGRGGWPLNCFATPEGEPVWGGTYFPKEKWLSILNQLANSWKESPEKLRDFAKDLSDGISQANTFVKHTTKKTLDDDSIHAFVTPWKEGLDTLNGGNVGSPKFPMPNNLLFLMRYAHQYNDLELEKYVTTTLYKMAKGGIYDQIGGGFARYSTDEIWKVPHFEKMLYDNAQLLYLYSEAFQKFKNPYYLNIAQEIVTFLEREMTSKEGLFFSAIDADSEGIEGKFYVWKEEELKNTLQKDYPLAKSYYGVSDEGLWEDGNNILLVAKDDNTFLKEYGLTETEWKKKKESIKKRLLSERDKRTRAKLDNKSIVSWNALTISGLTRLYQASGDSQYLKMAEKCVHFILKNLYKDDTLFRIYKEGEKKVEGFSDDYAFLIEALTDLYQVTFDETYYFSAKKLLETSLVLFFDETSEMFLFKSKKKSFLLSHNYPEYKDGVISSSNSSFAKSLSFFAIAENEKRYDSIYKKMLHSIYKTSLRYPSNFSNWGISFLQEAISGAEVVIAGKNCKKFRKQFQKEYSLNTIYFGAEESSEIPLFKGKRAYGGKTTIFTCLNKMCNFPVTTVEEAKEQLRHLKGK